MSFKNLMVHLSDDPRSEARIGVALNLAARHGANLTALYVIPVPKVPGYFQTYLPDEILVEQRRLDEAAAERARVSFLEAAERAGVATEWRQIEEVFGDSPELHARYFDLVVVGQRNPEAPSGSLYDAADELVMTAGRPVLAVPYAGAFESVGTRVLVGWDGTREASRAVHDALPILAGAEQVIVYRVNPPEEDHIPGVDIAAHLAHHGIRVEAHHTTSRIPSDETAVLGARSLGIGDILLSAAADMSADLLVMGAYGHARIREIVLGGTTRYVLDHMTIPVLMSH